MKKVLIGFASAILAAGCGGGGGGGGDCTAATAGGAMELKLVADQINLPTSATPYQYDFDGSGKKKNLLGNLLGLLGTGSGPGTPQGSVDKAVKTDGTFLLLMDAKADSFASADCAGVGVSYANTTATPKLDGTGTFTVAAQAGSVYGAITGGALNTTASVSQPSPSSTVTIKLPLLEGADPLQLNLVGVHVQGTLDATGKKITAGEIHGAIKNSELRATVFPAVATALTALLANPSTSASTKATISTAVDTGCMKPGAGETGTKGDGKIDLCEVKEGTVGTALSPDLNLFTDATTGTDGEAAGTYNTYKPTPADPAKTTAENKAANDCVSFGIGFTAVGATF